MLKQLTVLREYSIKLNAFVDRKGWWFIQIAHNDYQKGSTA